VIRLATEIKTASADAMNVITPLGTDFQSGTVLTALEIRVTTAAVAQLATKVTVQRTHEQVAAAVAQARTNNAALQAG